MDKQGVEEAQALLRAHVATFLAKRIVEAVTEKMDPRYDGMKGFLEHFRGKRVPTSTEGEAKMVGRVTCNSFCEYEQRIGRTGT